MQWRFVLQSHTGSGLACDETTWIELMYSLAHIPHPQYNIKHKFLTNQ